jgi:hypothetical protein
VTPAVSRHARWRDGIAAAALVTLARPASWATGLAGFLAGGGVVLLALPILTLPTMTGIQNTLGGPVSSLAFGGASPTLLLVIAGLIAGGAALLLAGTWIGAWAERAGIEATLETARDEGLDTVAGSGPGLAGAAGDDEAPLGRAGALAGEPGTARIVLLRLLSLVPVAAALGLAWPSIYAATYRELFVPGDVAVPVEIRVLLAIPGVAVGLVLAWLLSDTAAALGVRHLVLGRRGVAGALLAGWAQLLRRPHRAIATAVVGLGLPGLPAALALLGAVMAWDRAREALLGGRDALTVFVPVVLLVATWLVALVLAGAGAAFRSAAFTFEARHRIAPRRV